MTLSMTRLYRDIKSKVRATGRIISPFGWQMVVDVVTAASVVIFLILN